MRLAYITNQYGSASDTFIRQEVKDLRNLGHTVHTYSTGRPEAEHHVSADVKAAQSTTHYILDAGFLKILLIAIGFLVTHPIRAGRAIGAGWKTRGPGLISLLKQTAYLLEAAYLARRLLIEKVDHLHNHIAMNSATVAMLASILSEIEWSMTVHGPHDFVDPSLWAIRQKIAHAAFSVFIADFGKSQGMLLSSPDDWKKLHVVRCGLDESFLNSEPQDVPMSNRLLFVGRLAPEKGIHVLLGAVSNLKQRHDVGINLTIIGDGPSRQEIESIISERGLNETVTILGWQDSDRVRREILCSKALVLPSFAEGLPIVLMEAMALHRPVVATSIAGIPELVVDGQNGILVTPGSEAQLELALLRIISLSQASLRRMGENGACAVRERHNSRVNVIELQDLFLKGYSK